MDKKEITLEDFKKVFKEIKQSLQSNAIYLCELDSVIGDGDHGTTVLKGFNSAVKNIDKINPPDIKSMFIAAGEAIMDTAGGVSGVVFGSMFQNIAEYVPENKKAVSPSEFFTIFSDGIESFISMPKVAKPGEKTMVDALYPAVLSLRKSLKNKETLKKALEDLSNAAQKGAESTKDMIASKGRARYLGERSIGYQDPGATSISIILKSFHVIFNQE